MKKELMIEGMMCQNCVKHVTHALEGISGASHVQVSLEDKKATVEGPQNLLIHSLQKSLSCQQLIGNVHAVAILFNHSQNAVQLSSGNLNGTGYVSLISLHGG